MKDKKYLFVIISVGIILMIGFMIGGYFIREKVGFVCPDSPKCEENAVNDKDNFEGVILDTSNKTERYVEFDFSVIDSLETEFEMVDLAILGRYALVVEDKTIWFDDYNGFAMYNDKLVKLSDKTLEKISVLSEDKEGCCSCCPDLEPGEVCIALCCSCTK